MPLVKYLARPVVVHRPRNEEPAHHSSSKTVTSPGQPRSDGPVPRNPIKKRKASEIQSQDLSHQRWPRTLATQTPGSKLNTHPRNSTRPWEMRGFDLTTDQRPDRSHPRRPRALVTETLDSKLNALSRNVNDLNFRLRAAGSPPSPIWRECLNYAIELTSLAKEFELEIIINTSSAKSRLPAWLKMNNDIQVLKGILRGMAVEMLRLEGIR